MRKLRITLLAVAIVAAFNSCLQEDEEVFYSEKSESEPILMQKRDSEFPFILSQRKYTERPTTRSEALSFNEYLGRSFRTSYYPIETADNLGAKVVNIQSLAQANPSWFSTIRIGGGVATSYAYSSFERYTSNSTTTKTVGGGGNFNLGLFSLGSRTTVTTTFSETKANDINSVFGQVDVEIRDLLYDLTLNTNRIRTIMLNNDLDEYFVDDLYNMTPREFFSFYGGFVLSNFYTGGRATALYAGKFIGEETTENKEKHMNTDINASYGFTKGNANGDFGFGKDYASGSTSSKKVTEIETSIEVRGGSYNVLGFTPAQSIETVNINLSPWVVSLADEDTHVMVGIKEAGLIPITEFVLEENIKNQLKHYYDPDFAYHYLIKEEKYLVEPEIFITHMNKHNMTSVVAGVLRTRFDDCIVLGEEYGGYITHLPLLLSVKESYFDQLCSIFKINIWMDPTPPSPYPYQSSVRYDIHPNSIYIKDLDFSSMGKYISLTSGMMYILGTTRNGEKVGFTIYDDNVLDAYGIRAWVNTLSTINMTPQNLFNYRLIAL